jgi:phosphatidylinositol phospholipase C, beta
VSHRFQIVLPDLAILRIAVYEETGKLIGQRVLPLDGLQAGYRHISLRTEGNFPLSLPTIFCEIILKSYVPDGLTDFVDQLNKPLLAKKGDEPRSTSTMNSSESNLTSTSVSIRRNRVLTDSASAPNPSIDSRPGSTCASNSSVNTISTSDGTHSTASSTKTKASVETIVPITLDYLREQKNFMKLQHKQDKDVLLMKKKQAKEQTVLGEQQSKLMSKLRSECEKMVRSPVTHAGSQRKDGNR